MKRVCLLLLMVLCVSFVFAGCAGRDGKLQTESTEMGFSQFYYENYLKYELNVPVKTEYVFYKDVVESYNYNYTEFLDNMEYIESELDPYKLEELQSNMLDYFCCIFARTLTVAEISEELLLAYIGTEENPGVALALCNKIAKVGELPQELEQTAFVEEVALISAVDAFYENRKIDSKERPLASGIYEYKNTLLGMLGGITVEVEADSKNTTLTAKVCNDIFDDEIASFSFLFKNEYNEAKNGYLGITYKKHSQNSTASVIFDRENSHMEITLSTSLTADEFMPDGEEYTKPLTTTCETTIQRYKTNKFANVRKLSYTKNNERFNYCISKISDTSRIITKYGFVSNDYVAKFENIKFEEFNQVQKSDLNSIIIDQRFDYYERGWVYSVDIAYNEKTA